MIAHGSSSSYAIANAIRTAQEMVEVDIVQKTRDMVERSAATE
jgi:fatty acid/phospholipid biosynthesis enzyme